MIEVSPTSIIEHFGELEDPRVDRTRLHLLIDILVIALCAVISGADDWVSVEAYGNAKIEWLQGFLELPNGIPSHDTFGRVFARIKPEQFQRCFLKWISTICELKSGEVIAIDGKIVRNSSDIELDQNAIHMVSAYASSQQLVLAQVKVNEKSNEITAIPELLEVLDVAGCTITVDAMGCQKDIARQIIDQQAHYLLALKGNQPTLLEDVTALFEQILSGTDPVAYEFYQAETRDHGRVELRQYWTTSEIDSLRTKDEWKNLKSIGMVRSERYCDGETAIETRYFISSLDQNAEIFAHAIRSHWRIENSVHWILDVAFHEDACRIRQDYAPQNFAVLRHIALNLLRHESSLKAGIKTRRLRAGWDNDYLQLLLGISSS
jgi:predicted transposase YbfD/YdcC